MSEQPSPLGRVFGVTNGVIAVITVLGVFAGLHVRWWVVDVPAAAVAALLAVSSFGLLRATRWQFRVMRVSALVGLAIGLVAVLALAVSAGYLSGVHGGLGASGALTLTLVIALVLPYLVIYPGVQLLWLHKQERG